MPTDARPSQTDNRPRKEDGEQDLPQEPGSVVGTLDLTTLEQPPEPSR